MALFILKHYVCRDPENPAIGTLVQEWSIEARTAADAVYMLQTKIKMDYDERTDFLTMWDADGKHVWGSVTDA